MKQILRGILCYCVALFVTQMIFSGLHIRGGIQSFLVGGVLLALGFMVVKPILSVISFPINLITMGLFSWVITAIIFFGITKFYPSISVAPFVTPKVSFHQLHIPAYSLNLVLSYVAISATIYLIAKFIDWVFSE